MTDGQATVIAAVLAATFAALGFVAKLLLDGILGYLERRNVSIAKLVELDGLLRASRAIFETQNELAERLDKSVLHSQPGLQIEKPISYENTFVAAYPGMTQSEKTLHGVIRAITESAVKPLNSRLLDWLREDRYWRAHVRDASKRGELAKSLSNLEAHLHLWQAKHSYWMADQRHALVYLADEEAHGVGFPHGLDTLVRRILQSE
jgi:gamma-glutamylcyclotransferase (GGCT)/AIG2-like uncharacterized protein YtfP